MDVHLLTSHTYVARTNYPSWCEALAPTTPWLHGHRNLVRIDLGDDFFEQINLLQ